MAEHGTVGTLPGRYPDPEDAGRLVAWSAAALAWRAEIGQAAAAVEAGTHGHVVFGLPDPAEPAQPPRRADPADESMLAAVGWLRRARVNRTALVLPTPGDPLGLYGDSPLAQAALAAGIAVVFEARVHGFGWVPEIDQRGSSYHGVRWHHLPGATALAPPILDPDRIVEQADKALRRALRAATDTLAELDLAPWRQEAAAGRTAAESALRTRLAMLPPGWPVPARHLGERALSLWHVVRIVAADPGATSASAVAARNDAVQALSRAVREAAMVAFNVPAAAMLAAGDG